ADVVLSARRHGRLDLLRMVSDVVPSLAFAAVHHVCQPAILRKPASLRAATVAPCAGVGCARPTIGCRRPDLEIRDPCSAADDVGESGGRTVERHGTEITRTPPWVGAQSSTGSCSW